MNLFEIAFLEDEVVGKFQSDFRIVADYFSQMRKNKDYAAPDATIRHVHELLQLMSVMTGDNRYENAYSQVGVCEIPIFVIRIVQIVYSISRP